MTDGEPGLRERKRRALRERLVAIAGERFTAEGYDATSMREIADAAGIAYQTLYNHFPNKARLAMAWLEGLTRAANEDAQRMWETLPADPREAMLAGADLYVDMATRIDRRLWREVTAEFLHAPEDFAEMAEVLHLGARDRLRSVLARCDAAGTLAPGVDIEALADVIYALVDHMLLRFTAMVELGREQALEELHRQLDLVLRPWLRA